MRPENDDVPQAPKAAPCAACGEPSGAAIWETRLCYPCVIAWDQEAPAQLAAEARYPNDAERWKAFVDFTARWAQKRKGQVAA